MQPLTIGELLKQTFPEDHAHETAEEIDESLRIKVQKDLLHEAGMKLVLDYQKEL